MEFTKVQKKAIDTKNCSLLVAAGAGSGKTRVLTERIIDRILDTKNNINITDFLIVTFTKAAAEEMRSRIRKALTERSRLYPENKKLIRNIAILPQARISTISSFCLDMIKENYQKLGLSPAIRVAEENEINVLTDRITDSIIEERLSNPENYPYFITVYELLSGKKSDGPFSESIKKLYKQLTNLPSIRSYLSDVCDRYKEFADADELYDTFFGNLIKEYTYKDLQTARALLVSALDKSKLVPRTYSLLSTILENDIVSVDNILSSMNTGFDAAYYQIHHFEMAKKPQDRNVETTDFTASVWASVATARGIINGITESFYCVNSETYRKCALDYYDISKEISDIILSLDFALSAEKKENGIVSFSDVERYALELLYDDIACGKISDTAISQAERIKELYIDEYQDINPIQDMIFKALSTRASDGNECNRFMVGDSKQSIYGFRGARPDIFNGYRQEFADADTEEPRRKIFMQNNFRCSESVIDFTNMLFEKIMPDDYTESDKLIFSKISDKKIETPVKLLFCNTFTEGYSNEECRLAEAEALYGEIRKIVNNPDYISSSGKMYESSDVAILTRTWDEAALLEKFFTERNIPVICERGESFFERDEVKLALNIIRSVDNPERNICTAGFMRSAVCGFTDDELTIIRKNSKKTSLFTAVKKYPGSENPINSICIKIQRFLDMHASLRTLSRSCSAHEFVSQMYKITDLVNICTSGTYGGLENDAARIRKKNLSMLYDMSRNFDKTVFKGISAFSEYISAKENDSDDKTKSASVAGEGIRIMTIHKSKGLEFPVCFIYGAEKDSPSTKDKIIMHEKAGFAMKLKSLEKIRSIPGKNGFAAADTPFRSLIKRICTDTEDIEGKRLLYVALTRACDLLYITACPKAVKDYEKKIKENRAYKLLNGKNQLELILSYLYTVCEDFTVETPGEYSIASENGRTALDVEVRMCSISEKEETEAEHEKRTIHQPDMQLLEIIRQKATSAAAAKSALTTIPPKLTVSLLKHGLIDYEDSESSAESQRNPLEMPEFIRETAAKTAAEKGTAMHTFLQFASFEGCETDGCEKEADRLSEEGYITKKQREMLDISKLDEFFETPLYSHIKSAVKVHRELRFNLSTRPDEVIANVPDTTDFVLVQGVIDCFTENADGSYTVIDFKTDNIKAENAAEILTERYKNQLAFYCRAVEDITKKKVSKAVIFSFANMEEIVLDVDTLKFG